MDLCRINDHFYVFFWSHHHSTSSALALRIVSARIVRTALAIRMTSVLVARAAVTIDLAIAVFAKHGWGITVRVILNKLYALIARIYPESQCNYR